MRALVHLGANACIIGRNVEKTERVAKDIATVRPGAKVIGVGAVDVRKLESLNDAVARCVEEFGGIDFVMYVTLHWGGLVHADIYPVPARQAISLPRLTSFRPMLSSL